jgi:uncharacterized protein (TIGR02246 family)
MRFFLISAIISFVALSGPAVAADEHDREINAVYSQMSAARAAGDVGGMTAAFAPEGLLVDARPGPVISGAELVARLAPMAGRLRTEGAKVQSAYRIERRSIMGDIVLDAGFMRQTVTRQDGRKSDRYARFLITMHRGPADRWRIIGDASMPAEQVAFEQVKRTEELYFDS